MNDDNNFKDVEQPKEGFQLLLDSKYPLLHEFREKCPGTFKHSQSLSAMVEGISLELNLDVEFMRVASLYHDIGKSFNPKYFSENQLENEDPHKGIKTKMSYEILTRHVSDSVIILINDHNFPREIIEIISQHHGTNMLKYFYKKAKAKEDGEFRYKCSKPTCIEAAVLMIADGVEATSRSLSQSGRLNPIKVIDDTINGLLDDGQLDEVTMKLGDLKKIKTALGKELEGIYQKRIDYDELETKKE